MLKRVTALCVAVLIAATVGLLGAATPASAAAPSKEACRNLGNGNLCIRVVPGSTPWNTKVTVWYDKNAGTPRHIRLRYHDGVQAHWDDGHFWISAGQVRGYIWYDKPMSTCFTSQLQDITEGALGLINGGYVCF